MHQPDPDLQRKQELLQIEILDKGLDPFDFQGFCERNKGEESDIESWTYEEIARLILLYKEEKANHSPESGPDSDRFDFDFSQAPFEQKLDPLFTNTEQQSNPPSNLFAGEFVFAQVEEQKSTVLETITSYEDESNMQLKYQCKKLEPGILGKLPSIAISISSYEMVSGKLLQSSYIAYNIETNPLGWKVKRRFSDFVWLRKTLQKMYPGMVVPMLVEKSIQKNSQAVLSKRQVQLELFLNELQKTSEFRSSKFYVDFLRTDEKQFKQVTKDSEKVSKPTQFSHLINMTGQVGLKLDSKVRQQQTNFEALLNYQEPIYEKIKSTLKQLEIDFDCLNRRLTELGDLFVQLQRMAEKYDFTDKYRCLASQDVYKIMKQFALAQAEEMNTRGAIFGNGLQHFFRFHKMNLNSFREIQKLRNSIALEVEKRKEIREETFMEDLMSSFERAPAKSKESLDQPSKNIEILREQYAFYNWKVEDEAVKFQNRKVKTYSHQFAQFSQRMTEVMLHSAEKLHKIEQDLKYVSTIDLQTRTSTLLQIVESY